MLAKLDGTSRKRKQGLIIQTIVSGIVFVLVYTAMSGSFTFETIFTIQNLLRYVVYCVIFFVLVMCLEVYKKRRVR